MNIDIPVYKAEKELGLEQQIRSTARIAYANVAKYIALSDLKSACDTAKKRISKAIGTNENQFDLHYLSSLMVSTGWNNNDDVFDKQEMWLARKTPEDKPLNLEHDQKRIV